MADIELNEDPRSTYGASEEYKRQWFAKYGNAAPAGNAPKKDWVEFAEAQGVEDAENMKVDELKEAVGDAEVVISPSQGGSAAEAGYNSEDTL